MCTIREYLRSIRSLRHLHQWYYSVPRYWYIEHLWKPFCYRMLYRCLSLIALSRIRRAYGKRLIKVAFPLSNPSKWKLQSLYDLMETTGKYEPFVVITPMDIEFTANPIDKKVAIQKVESFLKGRGVRYVFGYDSERGAFLPFSYFNADVVWYTQPWTIAPEQSPSRTVYSAITCYTPYFVQNYGGLDMDCAMTLHRIVWRHFTLNGAWAKEFERYQGDNRAGRVVGLGHPALDDFYLSQDNQNEKKYIIYAPHFSCNIVECFSTFLKNGKEILALAKSHPEINWVFKPHPTLRHTLEEHCGWTREEINAYYAEWEKISTSCYDSNYVTLFKQSYALITDCASFLVEYACTGSPIIHLISSNAKYKPHPIAAKLFGTYYQAHNWGEFMMHFEKVVLQHDDYKRSERLLAIKDMRLLDNYAAKNIVNYLDSVFSGK